jgi:hypothetical protein
MAFLRILDHFFGSLALARKYERLFSMGDSELAARGLTQETLTRTYLEELAALDVAAAPAPREAKHGVHAPA